MLGAIETSCLIKISNTWFRSIISQYTNPDRLLGSPFRFRFELPLSDPDSVGMYSAGDFSRLPHVHHTENQLQENPAVGESQTTQSHGRPSQWTHLHQRCHSAGMNHTLFQ